MKGKSMAWFIAGIGSVVMYNNIKNGNVKSWISKMNKKKIQAIDELENMM